MLRCDTLSLGYPGKSLCRDLNLEIRPGECWAIIGKNGSGKTTLLHALGGLNHTVQERIALEDRSLGSYTRRNLAKKIGVLLQYEDHNFWGTVREYVLLGRYPHTRSLFGWQIPGTDIGANEIAQMGLTELASRPINTLSGGEWQRARIALLLLQQPHIYLLDEPLQHLDLQHQFATLELFSGLAKTQGKAVVIVLHDLTWLARYCDRALLLYENGNSIAGPTSEVLTLENLERLYQCRLKIVESDSGRIFLPC